MTKEAGILRCPSCGAATAPKDARCGHCGSPLHAIRCPWCFDWTYAQRSDCSRCGSTAVAPTPGVTPMRCPSCETSDFSSRSSGGACLTGCGHCGGVWADVDSFKRLCEDREAQAAYLGMGSPLARQGATGDPSREQIRYRPCPVCCEFMNRFNFAGSSGVILDACKPHGVWFDPDELRRIVAFIRGGGLDQARERTLQEIRETERRLRGELPSAPFPTRPGSHIAAAGGLLDALLRFVG